MNDEERAGYIERIGHLGKALDCQQREIGKLREMLIRLCDTCQTTDIEYYGVPQDIYQWWTENK